MGPTELEEYVRALVDTFVPPPDDVVDKLAEIFRADDSYEAESTA